MKVGDMIKFSIPWAASRLNGRIGIYLGEAFIHRSDGVVVENHKVLLMGEHKPTIIDRSLLSRMKVYNESR
jgi:hypothetical protein